MTPQDKNQIELSAPEEVSLPQIFGREEKKPLLELFILLAKRKFLIAYVVIGVAALSSAISLFLPKYYTGETKILPPQQGQSIASAMLDQLGGIGGIIGAAAGKELGLKNPNDLYVAMLKSNSVADDLIDKFSLMSLYKKKLRVDARKQLADLSDISSNSKDGTISVSVEDQDPDRAAAIANAYIDELVKLTKKLAVTDASRRRVFFEAEAKTATEQLEAAEQEFKKTQETTGIIQMDSQSRVMLQAYADLKAELSAKEIEIESMRSFATTENPELQRLQHERDALRSQVAALEKGRGGSPVGDIALEKVPEKARQYVDKLREVTYRNALVQLMLKQYEIARIDEAKDSALIQVLDKAMRPEKRSWPHRTLLVLSCTFLAFILMSLWCYTVEAWEYAKEDPRYLARLQLLKFYLSRGLKPGSAAHRE